MSHAAGGRPGRGADGDGSVGEREREAVIEPGFGGQGKPCFVVLDVLVVGGFTDLDFSGEDRVRGCQR